MRCHLLSLSVAVLLLSACASQPRPATHAEVPPEKISEQQARLEPVTGFTARGRIAFFDEQAGNREAARYHWQQQPTTTQFRLYHGLRGTLARLTADQTGARLTDLDGETHTGPDLTWLLRQQLGLALPIEVLTDAIIGRLPAHPTDEQHYYPDGTLASYRVQAPGPGFGPQEWELTITRYTSVEQEGQHFRLPAELELAHPSYRIRLTISNWELDLS